MLPFIYTVFNVVYRQLPNTDLTTFIVVNINVISTEMYGSAFK